jgi:hypothetical protein
LSSYTYGYYIASTAVDGTYNCQLTSTATCEQTCPDGCNPQAYLGYTTYPSVGSQAFTNVESSPWWTVDLNNSFAVGQVFITSLSLSMFTLSVGAFPSGALNPACVVNKNVTSARQGSYDCGGMPGRYVSVYIPFPATQIQLCELEVLAAPVPPA